MDFHRIIRILQPEHTLPAHEWKGAVLFLCDERFVYLIKRAEEMPTHGGQVAFIGGHKLVTETSPWETVRREFMEETGLNPGMLEFLGYLPVVLTARLQPIVPVMAKLAVSAEEFIRSARSNGEWVDLIGYSWEKLSREESWEYAWRHGSGSSPVLFHTIRAGTFESPFGSKHPHLLWGATAGMIWDFLRRYHNDGADGV